MKNKFITRKWFKTTNPELIKNTLGYINKELNTVSINLRHDTTLTISKNDTHQEEGHMNLAIGIKTENMMGEPLVTVYNSDKKESHIVTTASVFDALINLGFEEIETPKKPMTTQTKLDMLK